MKNLLIRVLSGCGAGAIVVGIVYAAAAYDAMWALGMLFFVIAGMATVEYVCLLKQIDLKLSRVENLALVALLTCCFIAFGGRYAEVGVIFAAAFQVLRHLRTLPHREGFLKVVAGLFGLLYVPWLLHYFLLLFTSEPAGEVNLRLAKTVMVLLMVWGYDAGAYLIGSLFGRHKAFPRVSPNKTWEGIAGGLLVAVAGGVVAAQLSDAWRVLIAGPGFGWLVLLAAFVSGAAQLGDVFASKLKRAAGVKDSGFFLPGHGGFLDRIDGLLFALPVFYFVYEAFVRAALGR
ncbi:phosphatidate cytidylyltransferase [Candidatus Bipolaricaulota bacterium]|nr:phosphatidate cytidylyltransferase [Candidatus Bipolaricaulota bacterium]